MLKTTVEQFQKLLNKPQAYSKKFRLWLVFQLLRLTLWIRKQSAYQALELKKKSASLIDAEIRLCRDSLPQIGEEDEIDMVVEYVARQLTNRPHLPELDQALQLHSEFAVALLGEAKASTAVTSTAKLYFLADAFFLALLPAQKEAEEASFMNACYLDPKAKRLEVGDLNRTLRSAKRKLRQARAVLAERSALKIDLSLSDASTILALLSVCVVISGYLYTHYFYSLFGIDVSVFFSLTDYLAASIEQIRYGAISTALGLTSLMFGFRDASMRSIVQNEATREPREQARRLIAIVSYGAVAISALTIYLDRPSFQVMQLTVTLLAHPICWSLSHKLFRRPLPVYAGMVGLLSFVGYVAVAGYQKYTEALSIDVKKMKTQVVLKDEIFKGQDQTYLLGSNSGFLFLFEPTTRNVHVIPRDQVKEVRIRK